MKHRADDQKNSDSAAATVQSNLAEPAKVELPLELDDIVAVAILDSVVKVKRRRSRSHGVSRRTK